MLRKTLPGLAVALALAAAAQPAHAQAPPGCEVRMTDACLRTIVTAAGYTPVTLSHGFYVLVKQDGWTMPVQMVISPNGTKIGLNANLGDVTEASVTGDQWRGLLAANADIDPSSFYYNATLKRLFLHRAFDNRDLTAGIVTQQLNAFVGNLKDTKALWAFTH